ncbi:innexin domain-containing protein [Ditylenchus destructor]|nr:innexin domain-containing protein [Ditylenchus destructor]
MSNYSDEDEMTEWVNKYLNFVSMPRGEDFVDMLNCRATPIALITTSLFLIARDYFGAPLQCWSQSEWKKSWIQYSHDYCLVENTYYVPMSQKGVPHDHRSHMEEGEISYYQWVPFILLIQAFFFAAPVIFWRCFDVFTSRMNLQEILAMAKDAASCSKEMGRAERITIANQLGAILGQKYGEDTKCCKSVRRCVSQSSFTFAYFVTKLLFIINCGVQMCMMSHYLAKNDLLFVYSTLNALVQGGSWADTHLFPRVTMCDIPVRQATGNHIQKYTVQCVLAGNMLNEKVFIAMWLWMSLLTLITTVNLIMWLSRVGCKMSRSDILKRLLILSVSRLYPDTPSKKAIAVAEDSDSDYDTNYETASEDEDENVQESGMDTSQMPSEATARVGCDRARLEIDEMGTANDGRMTQRTQIEARHKKRREIKRRVFMNKIEREFGAFVEYMGMDGVMLVKLMETNSNSMVTSYVVGYVFNDFVPPMSLQKDANGVFMDTGMLDRSNADLAAMENPYSYYVPSPGTVKSMLSTGQGFGPAGSPI